VPLILLFQDFYRFPVTFEVKHLAKHADLVTLVSEGLQSLGTFNSHSISLSLDDIERDNFLHYVKGSHNALVITYFVKADSGEMTEGSLGRAVHEKIERIDPEAGRDFRDQLDRLGGRKPGQVSEVNLHILPQLYQRLPIDHIYVVFLNAGKGTENNGLIAEAMPQVLQYAAHDNISNLIAPCLAYNWKDKNSVPFDDFFDPLLRALSSDGPPRHVYIPLYAEWPTLTLEEAIRSLNHFWGNIVAPSAQAVIWRLYRAEFRGTLFFLFVCLLISSFSIPLTIKNFLIIAFSFIGMTAAASKTAVVLTQGQNVIVHAIIQLCIWVSLAVGLRFFANWNPRNIFSAHVNGNE
jgi:hypothetical protein